MFTIINYQNMANKTIYPGMMQNTAESSGAKATVYPGMQPTAPKKATDSNKPIYGFLYSVSRTPAGEYWPLYVGANSIGRNGENMVALSEATVTEHHASLVIREMKSQGSNTGLMVFIQDTGSTHGTQVNGDSLDFNPRECKHGDIITIGLNYELYLIIVDPNLINLHPKPDFTPVSDSPTTSLNSNMVGGFPPYPGKGTIPGQPSGVKSDNPFDYRKATIYMPEKD